MSQRPMLFVLNLGDDEAGELDTAVERHKLGALQGRKNTAVVAVCGRLEAELAEMDEKERIHGMRVGRNRDLDTLALRRVDVDVV